MMKHLLGNSPCVTTSRVSVLRQATIKYSSLMKNAPGLVVSWDASIEHRTPVLVCMENQVARGLIITTVLQNGSLLCTSWRIQMETHEIAHMTLMGKIIVLIVIHTQSELLLYLMNPRKMMTVEKKRAMAKLIATKMTMTELI